MSRFDEIEKIVSRANRDLRACRLETKDVLWPLLRHVVGGKKFAWRYGLRNMKGKEGRDPRPGQTVAVGLVAATKDGRFTIGATAAVKPEPSRRRADTLNPSVVWKEIGSWDLVEGKPWDLPSPSEFLLKRIAAWADGVGDDRVTLTRAEAEEIIKEHSPPRIHGWRFVLAPGWTIERARAEVKKAKADLDKGIVDPERNRQLGLRAEVIPEEERYPGGLVSVFMVNSIMLHADNRCPPCLTMTMPWDSMKDSRGFNGQWDRSDKPFDGNLEWECPEFIEAVEVLTDPKTGATAMMKPKRRRERPEEPDEPEESPPRPDYGDKSAWRPTRTCSRVSSGACVRCEGEAFFSAWVNGDRVLCSGCFMEHFEPEKAAAKKAEIKAADEKRKSDLKLALKGELPGATVTESGMVFGPPTNFMGLQARQVLREGLYDTKSFVASKDAEKPFFQEPKGG